MNFLSEISSWIKKNWIAIIILFLLVVITYFNSLHNDLVSDDIFAIKDQDKFLSSTKYLLQNPRFIARTFLYFLVYKIGALNPAGYRIINILFHLGTVLLAYAIVPSFSKKKYLAFIIAAFTAVHPIAVESVTWISGGIYAQSAFFLLLSFLLYIRNHNKFHKSQYIWSIIFYIIALSSSEKVIVYPGILFLYEFCFFSIKKEWKKIIPYLAISIIWLLLLIPDIAPRIAFLKESRGSDLEFYNPLIQIPNALGGYIHLFLWPTGLSIYQYDLLVSIENIIINIGLFIFYIFGLFYSYKKNKLLFFWLCFFVINLGVTLNPFGLSWLIAERYAYLGIIGLYFVAAYFLSTLLEKKSTKELGFIIIGLFIFLLSIRSIIRNNDWKNTGTLWSSTAKTSPGYVASQNNLANIYVLNGEYEKAVEAYKNAININPNYSYSYYNLGYTLRILKKYNEAIPILEHSIKLNPSYWQSYEELGILYFELGKYPESEVYIRRAIELAPNVSLLWTQIGTLELKKGNIPSAKYDFEKAVTLDPKNAVARQALQKISSQ